MRIINLLHCWYWIAIALIMSTIGCSSSVKVTTTGRSSPSKSGAISLTEITLTASNSSPSVSDTFTISAKGVYSDSSTKDLTNDASWSVSSSVVELGNTPGSATASSEGDATITATLGEISGSLTISIGAAALKSLFILPGTGANRVGVKQSMTAIGVFAGGTVSDITSTSTWTSSNTSVATIDSSVNFGQATLLATGSTTITASRGGISATRVLTVDTPTLTSLAVAPTTLLLANGYTAAASVVGTYSDSQKLDLTSSATWSSSSTAVATVSNSFGSKGLVTGVSAGSSTLTAGVLSLSGTGVVNVTSATLSSIAINPSSLTIASGTKEQLKADGLFSDASSLDLTYSATWDSTNAAVSVNNTGLSKGIITGENDGSSNVRATQNSVTGSASVIVSTATLVSIAVTPSSPSITSTGQIQLKATGTFSDSSTQDITKVATWRSSDLAIAIVGSSDGSSAGLVAGNADGTATITASFGDKSGNTAVTVASGAARALSSIVVTPSSTVLSIGSTAQFTATGVYNDNTTTDITATSTWSVGDAAVLQDNTLGSITTLASGTTSVSATKDSLTGSAQVTVTVDQAAPPTPTGLAVSVVSSAQLNFSWTSGGGTTASYRYAYQSGAGAPANCSAGTTGTTSSTSVSITGLTANTAYTMIVCALNADSTPDSSAATAGVTGTTSGPSLLAYSGTSFSESSTNLGAITATRTITVTNDTFVAGGTYTSGVEYSVSGVPAGLTLVVTRTSATVLTLSFTGNAASHANANDTSSVSLTLNAAALTSGVASTDNNPKTISIDFNDPDSVAPTSGTFSASTSVGTSGFTLNWSAATDNETSAANLQYFVCSGAAATDIDTVAECEAETQEMAWTTNALTKAITGKSPGTTYYYNVVVKDAANLKSLYNGKTQATTSEAAPPSPTTLAGTALSVSSITFSWASGGGTTASYKYAYQSGSSAPANCNAGTTGTTASTSVTLTGLSTATEYSMIVCALNNNQSPDMSSASSSGSMFTKTAAPTTFAAAMSSSTQINLTWDDMAGDTSGYKIAYQAGASAPADCNSGTTTTAAANATSKSISGLTAGTQYSFIACTVNASSGNSAASSSATATTDLAPVTPTTFAAATSSSSAISLTWDDMGGDGGGYKIAYQSGASAPADCNSGTTTTAAANATSKSITGLTSATQYSFIICTVNSSSTLSAAAAQASAYTLAPTPTTFAATASSDTQINLSWDDMSGDTGGYKIAYQSGSSAPATCSAGTTTTAAANATTKSITGLTAGTQYSFIICTANATAGDSAASAGVSAYAKPASPTTFAAAASSTTQIDLTWDDMANDTNGYKIAYQSGSSAPANCSSGTTTTAAANATSKSITGLTVATQYSFIICTSSTLAGDSASSSSASKYTKTAAPSISATVDSSSQITISWSAVTGDTGGYKIAYQSGASAPANCNSGTTTTAVSGATSKAITGLTASTQYSFIACSINADSVQSAASSSATGTTSAAGPSTTTSTASTIAVNTAVGTQTWATTSNATGATNTTYATSLSDGYNISTYYLQASNFANLSVPAGATINGITVDIRRWSGDGQVKDNVIKLVKAGSIVGDNKAVGSFWPVFTTETATYGGASDLWGTTWADTDFGSTFGIVISTTNYWGGDVFVGPSIDSFTITVSYTP